MHELSLMEEVRRQALVAAATHGAVEITAVTLRVGEWSGVDADALRFVFPVVMAGTIAAAATLQIDGEAAAAYCHHCRAPFAPGLDHRCPGCGRFSAALSAGRALQLVALEIRQGVDSGPI